MDSRDNRSSWVQNLQSLFPTSLLVCKVQGGAAPIGNRILWLSTANPSDLRLRILIAETD
ncbi:unnamed protein product [Prunus brigantina]